MFTSKAAAVGSIVGLIASCIIAGTTAQEVEEALYNDLCNEEFCACVVTYVVTQNEIDNNNENWEPTCPEWMKTKFLDGGPYDTLSATTCLPFTTIGVGVVICDGYQNSFFQEYGSNEVKCVVDDTWDPSNIQSEGYWTGYEDETIGLVTSFIIRDGNDSAIDDTTTKAPVIVNYQHTGGKSMPECPLTQPFTNVPSMSPTITSSPTGDVESAAVTAVSGNWVRTLMTMMAAAITATTTAF